MRILFGFGNAQLGEAFVGKHLAEAVLQRVGRERDRTVQGSCVLRCCDQIYGGLPLSVEACEVRRRECLCQLSGSVRTKIHKQYSVPVGKIRGLTDTRRRHELVVFAPRVGGLQCLCR